MIKEGDSVLLSCKSCGKDFYRKASLVRGSLNTFCSMPCYREYDSGTERINRGGGLGKGVPVEERPHFKKIECRYCKKEFYRYRGHLAPSANTYCDYICRGKYIKENPKPKRPAPIYDYHCLHCGEKFQSPVSNGSKHPPKYCSLKCRREKGLVTLNCSHCGKEFTKRKATLKYAVTVQKTKNVFCSTKCCGVALGNSNRGKTGRKNKLNPDKRETLKCDSCGSAYKKLKTAYTPKLKYCSKECKAKLSRLKKSEYDCDNCGEAFLVYNTQPEPVKKACSKKCKAELTAKALDARK